MFVDLFIYLQCYAMLVFPKFTSVYPSEYSLVLATVGLMVASFSAPAREGAMSLVMVVHSSPARPASQAGRSP